MATSSSSAAATATPVAPRAAADENEELWNLIVLQSVATQARFREFHQQVELFIAHTGTHPLVAASTGPVRAAHDESALPLRERTTPAHTAPLPLVSDAVAACTRGLCAPSGAVRDATAMTALTKRLLESGEHALTADDKAQLAFVLDASFRLAPATAAILLSAFESAGGYGVLVGWVEAASAVADDAHKALAQLLLHCLARHRPTLPFSRKSTLQRLKAAQPHAAGRKTKNLLKEVIEKYKA